jgi:chemotaxis protein MotB
VVKERKKPEGAALWYVSYGDLVTNMLCFFVMLFSFSTLDTPKKRLDTVPRDDRYWAVFSINREKGAHQVVVQGGKSILITPKASTYEVPQIVRKVHRVLQKVSMRDVIKVTSFDQMVKIQIPANVLFESGSAVLRPGHEDILMALMPIVSEMQNDIRIDGHTDDQPTTSVAFPSNWELSTARACAVVRFYTERMGQNPDRFSAQGYAENRPQVENTSEANRERNRRIEMNVLVTKRKRPAQFTWD